MNAPSTQRRHYLGALAAGGALLAVPHWARADATSAAWLKNAPAYPRLAH